MQLDKQGEGHGVEVNGRDFFGKMGFEIKVALWIWHSRQIPPFAPQSMISLKP
jgi:hypothetical protein